MRKNRLIIAVAGVAALLAAACGGGSSSSSGSSGATTAATGATGADTTSDANTTEEGTSEGSTAPAGTSATTAEGSESSGDAAGYTGGTLVLGDLSPVQTFDPAMANTPQAAWLRPVYDTLVRRTSISEFGPGLATEWTLDDLVLTLKLRTDVTFTDGTPFDGEAVKANIERGKAAEGPLALTYNAIDSVVVVAPDTVELNLAKPQPSILFDLSGIVGMMLSPAVFDTPDLDRNPVGTGPWMFDAGQSVEGQSAVFTKNPNYWDPSVQLVDNVEVRLMDDPTALMNALTTGQVDASLVLAAQVVAAEEAGLELATEPVLSWVILILDRDGTLVPALGDARVRQAMAYAIDREAIVQSILFGKGGAPGGSMFAEGSPAFSAEANTAYGLNIEKAKQLLADAGYADGFEFTIPTIPPFQQMAEAVAGSLAEIGITAKVEVLQSDLTAAMNTKEYPVVVSVMPTESPYTTFTQVLGQGGAYNPFNPADPGMAELLEAAANAGTDPAGQGPAFSAVTKLVSDDALVITLAQGNRIEAYNPRVTGDRNALSSPPDPRGHGVSE